MENKELLYDPLFAKKPYNGWEDSEKGGFFGKGAVKKTIFILFLCLAIGFSLFFSFNALGKEKYTYTKEENGYRLSEFNGGENDKILDVEFVQNDIIQTSEKEPITSVRSFAVCCNEYLELIYIGKEVVDLEDNCFYYCTNLKAIIVDDENPKYSSEDGVLYNKDKTEIIIHPIKNNEYRAALSLGIVSPVSIEDCTVFLNEFEKTFSEDDDARSEKVNKAINDVGNVFTIPSTVNKINDFCFNYCENLTYIQLHKGIKSIGQMAFFKCHSLQKIELPDGLEYIGPDGMSYCENIKYIFVPSSVKEIGHHAFFGCLGVDCINMGTDDEKSIKVGESWLPKINEKSLKSVEVIYNQERRAG